MEKLKTNERRNKIIEMLQSTKTPIKGSDFASLFGVSRQVVVTDIAVLKAAYPGIVSTNQGYIMFQADNKRCVFKMFHSEEETADELMTIVRLGGCITNVYVDHRVYGTISKPLDIKTEYDVENFLEDIKSGVSSPLMNITSGYHFHTVEAKSEENLKIIEDKLREKGYLIEVLPAQIIYEPKKYGG